MLRGMGTRQRHNVPHDDVVIAWLHGIASRWASKHGWTGPAEGAEMDEALAELRDTATQGRKLRTDLLAHVAGVCLGASRLDRVQTKLDAQQAELLLAVLDGAEADTVERVAQATHQRMSTMPVGAPPFSQPVGAQAPRPGQRA